MKYSGREHLLRQRVDQFLIFVTLLTFCVLLQVYVTLARIKNFVS